LHQRIGWALLIVVILAAAGELGVRGFRRALSDMQDFAVIYSSTRAFETGKNPYDNAAMREAWLEANHEKTADPGPQDLALYPPATYLLLSPLALMDWTQVRWAWILINLLSVTVLIVTLPRYWLGKLPPWKAACATAFIFGFGPIHTAIAKGQLAVPVAALLALALAARVRDLPTLAAILIALAASLKPQIVAPIIVLYLIQKQWKALAVVAGVTSGLICMAWLRMSWADVSWIGPLLHNVSVASKPGGVYDPSPSNPLAFQLVNASVLFHRITSNQAVIDLVLAGIGVFVCLLLWKRGQSPSDLFADPAAFSAACVLGLVLIAHRYYDAAVLIFVFVWALRVEGRPGARVAIAGCLLMAFPVPALLISSGHARAPAEISQRLWDAVVIQQQSCLVLIILVAVTAVVISNPTSEVVQV
jgi:hypothetical protein